MKSSHVVACSIVAFALLAKADVPTQTELDDLKTVPQGYVVWGLGLNTHGQVFGMTDWGDGIYKANLGDTASILLDSKGHCPTINKANPTLIAYFAEVSTGSSQGDVWLMDCWGKNKRKITKQPINWLSALHWTDRNTLVLAGGANLCGEYSVSKAYLMDTNGVMTEINTGITFNSSCSGIDGIHVWGDRIIMRAIGATMPGGQSEEGVVLGTFNQDNPGLQPTYLYIGGECGPVLSTDSPQPTIAGHNTGSHAGYDFFSARDGKSGAFSVPFTPSKGDNLHWFTFAVNSNDWGYTATRGGGIYPYIVDVKNKKTIRQGWGVEGAAYGALYIGDVATAATNPGALHSLRPISPAVGSSSRVYTVQGRLIAHNPEGSRTGMVRSSAPGVVVACRDGSAARVMATIP